MVDFVFEGTSIPGSTPDLWVSVEEADAYLLNRPNGDAWEDSGVLKAGELALAQQRLRTDRRWLLEDPDSGEEAADDVKNAIIEQALFQIRFPMDERQALQVAGVEQAGIMKETYWSRGDVQIAPDAIGLLLPYIDGTAGQFNLTR